MKLMNGNVAAQKPFTDTSKGTQEVTQSRPHAFGRVGMNFTDTVAIIIPRPFFAAMRDGGVSALNSIVTGILSGIAVGLGQCKVCHMTRQRRLGRVFYYSQAHLTTVAPHTAQHRRAVIGKRATPTPLIGPSPRRVRWVKMLDAFFPPHSGTFHRFPYSGRLRLFQVACVRLSRSLGVPTTAPSLRSGPIPVPVADSTSLAKFPSTARPLALLSVHYLQSSSDYNHHLFHRNADSDRQVVHFGGLREISGLRLDWLRTPDNTSLVHGNVALANPHFLPLPSSQQFKSPSTL